MSSGPILVRKTSVEGRNGRSQQVKIYGERSFRTGAEQIPADVAMCKRVAAVLYAEYPGHAWSVEVGEGLCKISIPHLLGFNWGYFLHLDRNVERKDIIRAGGEILERFNIPRSSLDMAAYFDARKKVPLLGNFRSMHRDLIPGGNIRCR